MKLLKLLKYKYVISHNKYLTRSILYNKTKQKNVQIFNSEEKIKKKEQLIIF